jgi:hypothetical protein
LAKGLLQLVHGQRYSAQQPWRLFLEHGHAPSPLLT